MINEKNKTLEIKESLQNDFTVNIFLIIKNLQIRFDNINVEIKELLKEHSKCNEKITLLENKNFKIKAKYLEYKQDYELCILENKPSKLENEDTLKNTINNDLESHLSSLQVLNCLLQGIVSWKFNDTTEI